MMSTENHFFSPKEVGLMERVGSGQSLKVEAYGKCFPVVYTDLTEERWKDGREL